MSRETLILALCLASACNSAEVSETAPTVQAVTEDVEPLYLLQPDVPAGEIAAFYRIVSRRLPRYRALIRRYSDEHDFDWRLVAAIIYQESHFDPLATSPTGVRGIMQLTLPTAKEMDVTNRLDPTQSIRGGVAYLDYLHARFNDLREFDKTLFAMASYNVGYGHVRDAQALAELEGQNPEAWKTLRETLPLLSQEEFYSKTRYGRARGQEPVQYITRICNYYVLMKVRDCARREGLKALMLGPPAEDPESPARPAPRAGEKEGVPQKTAAPAPALRAFSHPAVCATDRCDYLERIAWPE